MSLISVKSLQRENHWTRKSWVPLCLVCLSTRNGCLLCCAKLTNISWGENTNFWSYRQNISRKVIRHNPSVCIPPTFNHHSILLRRHPWNRKYFIMNMIPNLLTSIKRPEVPDHLQRHFLCCFYDFTSLNCAVGLRCRWRRSKRILRSPTL